MKYLKVAALLLAAALFVGACGSDDNGGGSDTGGSAATPKAETPAGTSGGGEAVFTAVDFGFQGPTSVPAGKTKVTLKNDGKEQHMLVLIQLLQGKTFEDAQAFIEKNGINGKPPAFVKTAGSIPPIKPGDSKSKDINLESGNYIIACFVQSKMHGGKSHAELGMFQPLTVE